MQRAWHGIIYVFVFCFVFVVIALNGIDEYSGVIVGIVVVVIVGGSGIVAVAQEDITFLS